MVRVKYYFNNASVSYFFIHFLSSPSEVNKLEESENEDNCSTVVTRIDSRKKEQKENREKLVEKMKKKYNIV